MYQEHRDNIVGILYAKDLILVDPDDGVEISAVLSFRCPPHVSSPLASAYLQD